MQQVVRDTIIGVMANEIFGAHKNRPAMILCDDGYLSVFGVGAITKVMLQDSQV